MGRESTTGASLPYRSWPIPYVERQSSSARWPYEAVSRKKLGARLSGLGSASPAEALDLERCAARPESRTRPARRVSLPGPGRSTTRTRPASAPCSRRRPSTRAVPRPVRAPAVRDGRRAPGRRRRAPRRVRPRLRSAACPETHAPAYPGPALAAGECTEASLGLADETFDPLVDRQRPARAPTPRPWWAGRRLIATSIPSRSSCSSRRSSR